jgi:sporulation protein YlmC with PRC-barrel domain
MKNLKQVRNITLAMLVLAGATLTLITTTGTAWSQVAGSTTVGVTLTESSQLALGWSVKKSLLGKTVYNDSGAKVGKVEDLIISPDKNLSYVIVGAGGFVGIGRHDVAVPVSQIKDQGGKLVMAGATKDTIKSMPPFDYADDSARRNQFVAAAEQDVAKAKAKLADLQKKTATATGDTKAKLDQQIVGLQLDLKSAEAKLTDMKRAGAKRWKEFEADVNAATARLRKWLEPAAT